MPVKLVYELLPLLKKSVNSRVVNVTSVDGFISLPSNAAYCGSKHALEAYSDVLRCEVIIIVFTANMILMPWLYMCACGHMGEGLLKRMYYIYIYIYIFIYIYIYVAQEGFGSSSI